MQHDKVDSDGFIVPPLSNRSGHKDPYLQKGDVLWVPYRRDPLWPALVQNIYPKKISYHFFPLPTTGKAHTFTCHPKSVYALTVNDRLPRCATKELVEAYLSAVRHVKQRGWTKGSRFFSIRPRDDTELRPEEFSFECSAEPREMTPDQNKGLSERKRKRSPDTLFPIAHSSQGSSSDCGQPSVSTLPSSCLKQNTFVSYVFENVPHLLKGIWNSELVRGYRTPTRKEMLIDLSFGPDFEDHQMDQLLDFVLLWVRQEEDDCRVLPAFHLAMTVLLPEIIVQATLRPNPCGRSKQEKPVTVSTEPPEADERRIGLSWLLIVLYLVKRSTNTHFTQGSTRKTVLDSLDKRNSLVYLREMTIDNEEYEKKMAAVRSGCTKLSRSQNGNGFRQPSTNGSSMNSEDDEEDGGVDEESEGDESHDDGRRQSRRGVSSHESQNHPSSSFLTKVVSARVSIRVKQVRDPLYETHGQRSIVENNEMKQILHDNDAHLNEAARRLYGSSEAKKAVIEATG